MKTSLLGLLFIVSGSAWAQASCPMDFSQTDGMQKLNDMKISALPTAGQSCNIRLGDGTAADGDETTIYFKDGQPCKTTKSSGSQPFTECGDKLTKQMDSDSDHVISVSSSFTSRTSQQQSSQQNLQTSARLGYGKDESGNTTLFLYNVKQDGSVDKSHYVRLVQYKDPNRKNDCDIQTYGPNGQVGDFIETNTTSTGAQASGGGSCPAKEGKIAMIGSSSINFTSGQILSAINDTKARVGDMNGNGFNTSHYATASQ